MTQELERGDIDYRFSATYEELRRLASTVKGADPSATLNLTALVNEAWINLAQSSRFATTSQLHFKRIAARAMRQVQVEVARRRNWEKRGEPRQLLIVESRFFGGFEVAKIAETLEASEATILRGWRAAKAWLAQTLRQ